MYQVQQLGAEDKKKKKKKKKKMKMMMMQKKERKKITAPMGNPRDTPSGLRTTCT